MNESTERLANAIVDLVDEKREEIHEESFRLVMETRIGDLSARLARVESRQDATMLLIAGAIVGQVATALLGS